MGRGRGRGLRRVAWALGGLCLVAGSAAGLAACAPPSFVRIRSVLTVSERPGEAAEVVAAREIDRVRGTIGRVAVAAPDACPNLSGSAEVGVATDEREVLHLRCAVELATLERALTAAGFAVISWRQIRDAAEDDRTTLQAARAFGAQLLIDVNALDWVSRERPPIDARWDRTIHESNEFGEARETVAVDRFSPQEQSTLAQYAQRSESEALRYRRLGAGLNATVVSTETAQSLWFYRRFVVEANRNSQIANVLLRRESGTYIPAARVVRVETSTELVPFRPSSAVTSVGDPDHEELALYSRQLGVVVTDFIAQLTARIGPPTPLPAPVVRREEPAPPAAPAPLPLAAPVTAVQPSPPEGDEPAEAGRRRRRRRRE